MAVDLSIKNVPDDVAELLRKRAKRNRRSLEGELLAIAEAAVEEDRYLTPMEVLAEVRKLGLRSPSESAEIVRAMRDGRYGD
jgi:plasmid stability protein